MTENTLTPSQTAALEALVTTKNITEAAAAAGLTDRTIRNYMTDPAFRAELTRMQSDRLVSVTMRATAAMDDALTALVEVAQEGNSDQARINAALALLRCGRDLMETYTIDERLTRLETMIH